MENKSNNLQNGNFESTKFLVVDIEFGGFGAMIDRRRLGLHLGFLSNRCVIFRNSGDVYDNPFIDISKWYLSDIQNNHFKPLDINNLENQNDKFCYFDFMNYWNSPLRNQLQYSSPYKGIDFRYYHGFLLSRLKLKSEYEDFYLNKKNNLDIDNSMIGVHVRRGDKIVDCPYIENEIYYYIISDIKNKTGINKIYLTSDDSNLVNDFKRDLKDFEIIWDYDENRYGKKEQSNLDLVRSNHNFSKQEALTGIKTIKLLSDCNYIIGQSNAQFSKLSILLSKYRNINNMYYLIDPDTKKIVDWENIK